MPECMPANSPSEHSLQVDGEAEYTVLSKLCHDFTDNILIQSLSLFTFYGRQ